MDKAQLKIQQMAFMLMAVFLFFILAGLFYLVIQGQDFRRQASILERNRAIEMANTLAGTAEFSCGPYCVDLDRVMALRNRTAYKNFWKVNRIEIRIIDGEKEKICTDGNYPECNLIRLGESTLGSSAYSFVSVCYRENNNGYIDYKCEIGKFIVGYDVKN